MERREEIIAFLKNLREEIMTAFGGYENYACFERTPWTYHKGVGGGEMGVMRGQFFEKVAVNWSGVGGDNFPMKDGSGPFFATGISLITHMHNPHAPTVHMNIRYIETAEGHWFGGGYDLTPMGFPYPEDTEHFHKVAKEALGEERYVEFSSNAATKYFYIPHWKKSAASAASFLITSTPAISRAIWPYGKKVGTTFLQTILPIYRRRINQPFTPEDRKCSSRCEPITSSSISLYDRGTQFGFALRAAIRGDPLLDASPSEVVIYTNCARKVLAGTRMGPFSSKQFLSTKGRSKAT